MNIPINKRGKCQIDANCSRNSLSRSFCIWTLDCSSELRFVRSLECRCRIVMTPDMMKQIAGSTDRHCCAFHCRTTATTSSQCSIVPCQRLSHSAELTDSCTGNEMSRRAACMWRMQISRAWCLAVDSLTTALRATLRYREGSASRTAERLSSRLENRTFKRSDGFCFHNLRSAPASFNKVVVTMWIFGLGSSGREIISFVIFQSISGSTGRNIAPEDSWLLPLGREVWTRAVLTLSSSTTKGVAAVILQYESRQ